MRFAEDADRIPPLLPLTFTVSDARKVYQRVSLAEYSFESLPHTSTLVPRLLTLAFPDPFWDGFCPFRNFRTNVSRNF